MKQILTKKKRKKECPFTKIPFPGIVESDNMIRLSVFPWLGGGNGILQKASCQVAQGGGHLGSPLPNLAAW